MLSGIASAGEVLLGWARGVSGCIAEGRSSGLGLDHSRNSISINLWSAAAYSVRGLTVLKPTILRSICAAAIRTMICGVLTCYRWKKS